eukprot:151019_1
MGAPSTSSLQSNYPRNNGCYAIAVHLNNGSLWWKVTLGKINHPNDYHKSNYAKFIGRFVKIDIEKHIIVSTFYPFNIDLANIMDEYNMSYSGIGIYNYPSIIDNYIVFGTGNLASIPYKIAECLTSNSPINSDDLNDYLLLNQSNYIDMC